MIRTLRRAAALAAVVVLAAASARAEIADRLDAEAPEFSCTKWWNGPAPTFAKLRGRVVILCFGDPGVVTSKAAAPALAKVAEKWKDAPVTIVEVAVCAKEETAADWATKNGGRLLGWDSKGTTSAGYPGTSVPRAYVIGPDGRIVWHAHIGALTDDVVKGQVARVIFFSPPKEAKKTAAAARLAGEQRYGAALAETSKLALDRFLTDPDREVIAAIRAEIPRSFAFQKKLLDTNEDLLDWPLAVKRVERMEAMFRGTEFEKQVADRRAKLDGNPRVAWVCKAQKLLDEAVEDAAKAKSKRDFEAVIERFRGVEQGFPETKPSERAREWREAMEKRLEELRTK